MTDGGHPLQPSGVDGGLRSPSAIRDELHRLEAMTSNTPIPQRKARVQIEVLRWVLNIVEAGPVEKYQQAFAGIALREQERRAKGFPPRTANEPDRNLGQGDKT